jgi:hypothetical protein
MCKRCWYNNNIFLKENPSKMCRERGESFRHQTNLHTSLNNENNNPWYSNANIIKFQHILHFLRWERSFYVYIVTYITSNVYIRVKMNEFDYIHALKRRIARKTGIPSTCQTLLYKGINFYSIICTD